MEILNNKSFSGYIESKSGPQVSQRRFPQLCQEPLWRGGNPVVSRQGESPTCRFNKGRNSGSTRQDMTIKDDVGPLVLRFLVENSTCLRPHVLEKLEFQTVKYTLFHIYSFQIQSEVGSSRRQFGPTRSAWVLLCVSVCHYLCMSCQYRMPKSIINNY